MGADPIITHTILDPHHIGCPLCDFKITVPEVPVSDALGGIFGMSGDTLARVHAEQIAKRVSAEMESHLAKHTPLEWLNRLQPGRRIVDTLADG